MTSILAIPLILLGEFSFRIAPERTHPVSYTDEPVLVEINGIKYGDFDIAGVFTDPHGQTTPFSLGVHSFQADEPSYLTIPYNKLTSGLHELTLHIDEKDSREICYRLRRPAKSTTNPFRITFSSWSNSALEAALDIPISEARIYASNPNFKEAVSRLSTLGIPIHLVAHQSHAPATNALLEQWVDSFGEQVASWEFDATDDLLQTNQLILNLQRIQPKAQVAIRVPSPDKLEDFLDSRDHPFISKVVITNVESNPDKVHAFRMVTELAGLENTGFLMEDKTGSVQTSWNHALALLTPLAPITFDVPAAEMNTNTDLERIAIYNQWADIFSQYVPVGPYYIHNTIHSYLFRSQDAEAPWLMALTADTETALELPVEFSSASWFSNVEASTPIQGETILVSTRPTFIAADNADVISQALCNTVALDAGLLLAVESYSQALSEPVLEALTLLKTCEPGEALHNTFFLLIRQLPELERQYHEMQLPALVVIPLMARLTRIARTVCALEQESSNAFLEPAEATLTRCNEFLAEYLSKDSNASQNQRSRQLFDETNRLMMESLSMSEGGRPIEAAGIAIIAEWRARALLTRNN